MSLNPQAVKEAEKLLEDLLSPELRSIVEAVTAEPGSSKSFFIEIPDPSSVDLHVDDLGSLVARTSNNFARAARFAGLARGSRTIAEAKYKIKFKISKRGKNEAEREQAGMEAAQAEYLAFSYCVAIVELAESMEVAGRIASESTRKLFDKAHNMQIGYNRELKGKLKESDWTDDF